MVNLALRYSNQKRWKEGEELFVQVMVMSRKVLGEEHPTSLKTMDNLASTYQNQRRWRDAEELGLQVLNMGKWVVGREQSCNSPTASGCFT
jgi:hypothetical protein